MPSVMARARAIVCPPAECAATLIQKAARAEVVLPDLTDTNALVRVILAVS
jgi:hypothetical protein